MAKRGGSKFYQTEEFQRLREFWVTGKNSKVARSGFIDAEYANETLKSKNQRTQAYSQQDDLIRISSALMSYVHSPRIRLKRHEKRILELHSQGAYNKEIAEITGKSHQTVWKVIQKNIPLALGLYAKEEEEVDTLPPFCRDET